MPVRRMMTVLALAMVAAGVAVAFRPLHAAGVTGNALRPHYGDFGWFAYQPLTGPVTVSQLRRAGVHIPQDDVDHRRRVAGGLIAGGFIVGVSAVRAGRRAATG
jgi:hypothetical protein